MLPQNTTKNRHFVTFCPILSSIILCWLLFQYYVIVFSKIAWSYNYKFDKNLTAANKKPCILSLLHDRHTRLKNNAQCLYIQCTVYAQTLFKLLVTKSTKGTANTKWKTTWFFFCSQYFLSLFLPPLINLSHPPSACHLPWSPSTPSSTSSSSMSFLPPPSPSFLCPTLSIFFLLSAAQFISLRLFPLLPPVALSTQSTDPPWQDPNTQQSPPAHGDLCMQDYVANSIKSG